MLLICRIQINGSSASVVTLNLLEWGGLISTGSVQFEADDKNKAILFQTLRRYGEQLYGAQS